MIFIINMEHSITDFLESTVALGPVRAVLRTCSGLAEVFCSTEGFEIADGWLNLRREGAHLHIELDGLCRASLQATGDAVAARPAIWLFGRCGSPCLLLICDQTDGVARSRQDRIFTALRHRFGERPAFAASAARPASELLH